MTIPSVRILDIASVLPGFSAKGALADEPHGTHQVIAARHLTEGEPYRYRDEHRLRITPPRSIEKYLVEMGDVLFMSRGSNNYAVLLENFPRPAIAPLTFFILRAKKGLFPAYIAWCLNQPLVQAQLNEIRTGAGTPMIPRTEFAEIVVPLPPEKTQKKIAGLAELQCREKTLLLQLTKETERLHRMRGQQLLSRMTNISQE